MAPEQAAGEPADSRSDIYSPGAIIYQLVTGVAPFTDTVKGGAAIIVAVREAGPTPIDSLASDVPAEVVAICEQAMSRDPGERYSSASGLARHIHEAVPPVRPNRAVARNDGRIQAEAGP